MNENHFMTEKVLIEIVQSVKEIILHLIDNHNSNSTDLTISQ